MTPEIVGVRLQNVGMTPEIVGMTLNFVGHCRSQMLKLELFGKKRAA